MCTCVRAQPEVSTRVPNRAKIMFSIVSRGIKALPGSDPHLPDVSAVIVCDRAQVSDRENHHEETFYKKNVKRVMLVF